MDARVALAILETLQREDLPEEVLVDENLSITLPRRLGLSRVIHVQVERYREEVRRGRRIPEAEVADLFRLLARRPDARRVFGEVGRSLGEGSGPGWRRVLPRRLALGSARRQSAKLLRRLFGRGAVRAPRGDSRLVGNTDLFRQADLAGSACALVTGIVESVAESSTRVPIRVRHSGCTAAGASTCVWQLEELRPELVVGEAATSTDTAVPESDGSDGSDGSETSEGGTPRERAAGATEALPPEDGEALSA